MPFEEDPGVFLEDFGVIAVFGAVTGLVLLDTPDEDILSGHAQSTEYAITYSVADFPDLEIGDSGTVNGVAYTIGAPPRLRDDGAFAVARLEKV